MPSVDAAPAHVPAPKLQADSARPDGAWDPRRELFENSQFFAALFASARLARREREQAAQTEAAARPQPADERGKPADIEPDSQRGSAAEKLADSRPAGRRERLKQAVRDDRFQPEPEASPADAAAEPSAHASPARTDTPAAPAAVAVSASDPPSSPHASAGQTAPEETVLATGEGPVTLVGSAGSPAPSPPGLDASHTIPGSAALSVPGQAAVTGAPNPAANGSRLAGGSAVAAVQHVVASGSAGATGEPGTDTAGGQTAARQNPAGAAAEAGESAKPAPPGGSFDPLLQAAARTRGQLAARNGPAGVRQEQPQVVRPSDPQSVNELARVVRLVGRDGHSKMLLRLDPPELGQLRIDVRMQDQTLTLRMEAQTQAGYHALNSRLGELKQALEQQGVQVQHMEVELSRSPAPAPTPTPDQMANPHGGTGHDGAASRQSPNDSSGSPPRNTGYGPAGERFDAESDARGATAESVPWYVRRLNLVA